MPPICGAPIGGPFCNGNATKWITFTWALSLLFNRARGPHRFPVAVIWISNPLLLDIPESEKDFQIRPCTNITSGTFHTS